MRPFDYVSVLLSIVISLALAHQLSGIAHMIQNGIRRYSLPLMQWIGFCLFLCIDYWFSVWHAREVTVWSLPYVSLLLTQAALIYIASRLVVPAALSNEPIDMTAFFDHNRRKFMGVVIILSIVNEGTNLTLPGFGSWVLGLMAAGWILLLSVGWIWKSENVQLAVAAINVALTALYAATFVPAL